MILNDIRKELPENSIVFDNPSFDKSIIGYDQTDIDKPRIIYDYDKMIAEFMNDNNCSAEDAIDFIEYNTIGACSSKDSYPIIMYPINNT